MKKTIFAILTTTLGLAFLFGCKKEASIEKASNASGTKQLKIASFYTYNNTGQLYINGFLMDKMDPMSVSSGDVIKLINSGLTTTCLRPECTGGGMEYTQAKIFIDNKVVVEKSCNCKIELIYSVP